MKRGKLFIGCSSEELELAEAAKSILEDEFDVTIWNEKVWDTSVFKLNSNFLSDLLIASLQFDFGIILGTKDDKVLVRGKEVLQPRDNILFELGLFTGRLGTSRCAFLIDKEIKLLSDFNGLTLAQFDNSNSDSFSNAVKEVKSFFINSSDDEINFFPSVTLASVYFENLISPVCRFIIENSGFNIEDSKYTKVKFNVIIPRTIDGDVNLQFEKLKREFMTEVVTFKYAGRPRSIQMESQIKDGTLEFIDFPTIVTGINHAIANLLPHDFDSQTTNYSLILERELRRFVSTLTKLIVKNGFNDIVSIRYK